MAQSTEQQQPTPELVELERQHFKLCAEAGKLQYELKCHEQRLHELNLKISEITAKHVELTKPKLAAVPTNPEVASEPQIDA